MADMPKHQGKVTTLDQMSVKERWAFGLLFIALGLFPALATFDIGPLGTADINGPPWMGLAAGGVFIIAGLAVIIGAGKPILSGILMLVLLAGLGSLGNWIAFGVGERVCNGSILFWAEGYMSGLACRIPFGYGAIVTNGIVLLVLVITVQKALGGPPKLARLRRWTENLLLLLLAPILLPMILVLAVQVGYSVVKTRLETGSWPRNEKFIAKKKAEKAATKKLK
jgi:hypothetical protein